MHNLLKYLLNMKRLPIVIMMVVAGFFLAFQTTGSHAKNPPSRYEEILKLVGRMLEEAHFSPQDINDDFSKKVFKKFIEDLDPEKNIFLASDIDGLRKKYETRIDDEIKGAPVEFFLATGKIFNQRMEEASSMANAILQEKFNYSIDEEVLLDGEKLDYADDSAEIRERWRKKLKYLSLERYSSSLEERDKNKDKEDFKVRTDAELEKDARDKTKKVIDRVFERFRYKFNDDDKF